MKVINNSSRVITLVNGKKVGRFDSVNVNEVTDELLSQIENLKKLGLIRTEA